LIIKQVYKYCKQATQQIL